MTDELEQRLRRALREQAHGVEPPADPTGDVYRRVRRRDRRQRAALAVGCMGVLAVLGAGVLPVVRGPDHIVTPVAPSPADEPGESSETSASREEGTVPALGDTCENPAGGFRIRYPDGWHTNEPGVPSPFSGEPIDACRYFHPEPFTTEQEFSGDELAVGVSVTDITREGYRPYNPEIDDVTVDHVTVDGYPAVRIDAVAGDYAAHPRDHRPPWDRLRAHVIDLGNRRILVTTSDQAEGIPFEKAAAAHDRMVDSLRLRP